MKLSAKISLSMASLAIIMVGLAVYNLLQMSAVNDISTLIAKERVPAIVAADAINNAQSEARIAEIRHIYTENEQDMRNLENTIDRLTKEINSSLSILEPLLTANTRPLLDKFKATMVQMRQLRSDGMELSRQMKTEEAITMLVGPSQKAYDEAATALTELVKTAVSNAGLASDQGDMQYASAVRLSVILLLIAIGIAIALTAYVVRNTLRQLGKDPGDLAHIASRVTNGDYNIDDGSAKIGVYGNIVGMVDALKENIENAHRESENAKGESLRASEAMKQAEAASAEAQSKTQHMLEAADRLEQVANVVSSASTELSAQIEQSDQGTAESAARLGEAATAMNEMNATVLEVARNAGSAADASASTRQEAQQGAAIVEQSVGSIRMVQQQTMKLKQDMEKLSENAQSITQIMSVISDIADQTNLLALNAAIEAARAGDAGRGFAVVADEVRNLAEKTMASTTDVGNAIKAIQTSVSESMSGMDHVVGLVDDATTFANQSGTALQTIVNRVDETVDQVRAIAAASEQQSAASEEINQSIAHVNVTANQTAQAMQEAARAVSDLAKQAQDLSVLIADMKRG